MGIAGGPMPEPDPSTTLKPPVRPGRGVLGFNAAQMVDHVGTVEPRQLAYASAVLGSLPDPLKALAYEPFGARAIVFALLVDNESEAVQATRARTAVRVRRAGAGPRSRGDLADGARPDPELRLPLVSMVVPTLRRLSRDQFGTFAAGVRELIQADNQVSLYEYAMHRLILRHLAPHFGYNPTKPAASRSAGPPIEPVRHVLGTLAHIGNARTSDAAHAFALGIQALGWSGVDPSLPPPNLDLQALDRALNELDAVAPPLKRQILALHGLRRHRRARHPGGRGIAPCDRRRDGMPRPAAPVARGRRGPGGESARLTRRPVRFPVREYRKGKAIPFIPFQGSSGWPITGMVSSWQEDLRTTRLSEEVEERHRHAETRCGFDETAIQRGEGTGGT